MKRSMFACAMVCAVLTNACTGSTEPADGGDVVAPIDIQQPTDTPPVDTGADVVQAAANSMCAMPTTVTAGTPVAAEDPTRGGTSLAGRCLTNARGKVLYYRTNVPAGQTLVVTATPTTTMDPVIRFLDSCTASTCVGFDRQPPGAVEEGHWANTGTAAVDAIFSVGAFEATQTGTFDVSATLVATPHASTCATADLVTSGMMVNGDMRLADAAEGICVTQSVGFAMFYRVSIPASQQLTVTVTPMGTWNPVVRVMDSCTATACLSMGDTALGGMPETLTYRNSGAAAAEVFVAVSPEREADVGTFSATFTVAP